MKRNKIAAIAALVLFGLAISSNAAADRRGHQSVIVAGTAHILTACISAYGLGIMGCPPYAYYPPYPYYYRLTLTITRRSSQHLRSHDLYRARRGASPSRNPRSRPITGITATNAGYYPYVKQCPGGWQKVSPQPPEP